MKKVKITEGKLRNIINECIQKVKNELLIEHSTQEKLYEIKEYLPGDANWEYIKENKLQLWEFLNKGYSRAGYEKFCGCDNARSLLKNANLIKIAFMGDKWIALSVYTGYKGGFKNVGITATTDEILRKDGIAAVHEIIKKDIGGFSEFFWTECSGAVEKLYEKYKGIKIPNEYAFGILQIPISLEDDGFHYSREIKGDIQRKVIYGFNNKETFEKVLTEREEYINSCINTILSNQINEDIEKPSFGRLSKVDCAIAIVNFFVNQRWEGECYEFPKRSLEILQYQVGIIENAIENNSMPKERIKIAQLAIENGRDILETSCVMQMNYL